MFCPKCGSADQTENSYCRNCGEFLPDLSNKFNLIYNFFGFDTPEKHITANLIINFLTLIFSVTLLGFLIGYYDAAANKNPPVTTPGVVYFVYAFLILISIWQILGIFFAVNLKNKFSKRNESREIEKSVAAAEATNQISAKTQESLPAANFDDLVRPTATEETTRNLTEKVKRSPQSKQ